MNCPKCYEPLRISDRQGIEIDYCPECRGVWLDRGELDKVIERTLKYDKPGSYSDDHRSYESNRDRDHDRDRDRSYKKKSRKKSKTKHVLKEIFDLFD